MKLTLSTFLRVAPVLGDMLYDAAFIVDSGLAFRTTSKGANCVSSLRIPQNLTNKLHQCSQLQVKLGSLVSVPGSTTFISEQNDTALGY